MFFKKITVGLNIIIMALLPILIFLAPANIKAGDIPDPDSTCRNSGLSGDANKVWGKVYLEDPDGLLAGRQDELEDLLKDLPLSMYVVGRYTGNGQGQVYCETTSDENGNFEFTGVAPGQYQIMVWADDQGLGGKIKTFICEGTTSFFGNLIAPFLGPISSIAGAFCNNEDKKIVLQGGLFFTKKDGEAFPQDPNSYNVFDPKVNTINIVLREEASWGGVFSDLTWLLNGTLVAITNFLADKINGGILFIDNLMKNPNVVNAWGLVRDAANILLIAALLIIAVGTATRFKVGMDEYAAKALIPRLIIAAIFMNFSLLITQGIIDVSNLLTLYFGQEINFVNILPIGGVGLGFLSGGGMIIGGLAAFFFGGFIILTAIIAVFTVLAILVVRIGLLWVLAIFSPLIFLFNILPFTKSLNSMWWKYLIQFAFMGPVMALLLKVASMIQ
jgi:hypothetical protein